MQAFVNVNETVGAVFFLTAILQVASSNCTCFFNSELPPAPFNILACNVTDTSATITWSLAEGNSISKVTILYQREQDDLRQLVEIAVPRDQLAMLFQLRGLLQDTFYRVDLWTTNNIGESQDRSQIEIKTLTHQESASEPTDLITHLCFHITFRLQ